MNLNLVASLIVRNEMSRYLEEAVGHLLEFCDLVAVLDDGSDDGTLDWLSWCSPRVRLLDSGRREFFAHEGRARQALLEWTLRQEPTHVLAVDADEFVSDGRLVRKACEDDRAGAWTLEMEEVWELDGDCLCVREDGGWRTHPVPIFWRVPAQAGASWRIADRALACGREPAPVRSLAASPTGAEVLHLGWANEAAREARHARYAEADGGRFHAGAHLDSILAPPDRVTLRPRPWPPSLEARRAALAEAIAR